MDGELWRGAGVGAARGREDNSQVTAKTVRGTQTGGWEAGLLTGVGGWCGGRDRRKIHLGNVEVITVVRILGGAHTAEIGGECL